MTNTTTPAAADIAPAIARILTGWTAVPNPHHSHDRDRYELHGPPGQKLDLRSNGYRHAGRIVISGTFPRSASGSHWSQFFNRHELGEMPTMEITCSLTRTPAAIAADIARRLLPQYVAAFIEAERRIADHDMQVQRQQEIRQFFAREFGAWVSGDFRQKVRSGKGPGSWDLDVSTAGSISQITLRGLDLETAAEILSLYQQARAQEAGR